MATQDITTKEFQDKVLTSEKYVLVDFWAPWCGPCRAMAPGLEELSEDPDLSEKLEIVKLNIEEGNNRELAILFNVQGIPNMKLFHKGKVVQDFVGMRPTEILKQEIIDSID